jgi:hypothetical protein
MPMDFSSALGSFAIVSMLLPILGVLLSVLLLVFAIREGISQGLRKHQLWLEKTGRSDAGNPYPAITPPPPRQF